MPEGAPADKRKREKEQANDDFMRSIQAILPWTKEGKMADYAEERLDALDEMTLELRKAEAMCQLVAQGGFEIALHSMMKDTEGQSFSDFHKHRSLQAKQGAWTYLTPTELRKQRKSLQSMGASLKAVSTAFQTFVVPRRETVSRVRDLCAQVRQARKAAAHLLLSPVPSASNGLADKKHSHKRLDRKQAGAPQVVVHVHDAVERGLQQLVSETKKAHPTWMRVGEIQVLATPGLLTLPSLHKVKRS